MPEVKLPYTPEGEEVVENIKEEVESIGGKIDYGENNVVNAPDNRENYQLGGLIPGQQGFGQNPLIKPPLGNINAPLIKPPLGNEGAPLGMYEEGGEVEYKKGGKVKK